MSDRDGGWDVAAVGSRHLHAAQVRHRLAQKDLNPSHLSGRQRHFPINVGLQPINQLRGLDLGPDLVGVLDA